VQAIGGTQGTQAAEFDAIQRNSQLILNFLQWLPPSLLQTALDTFPGLTNLPLGDPADLKTYSLNLQDSIPLDDGAQVPLQFVFEPADYRSFYTAETVQEQNALLQYAHHVVWGGKSCAWGSMGNVAPNNKNSTGAGAGIGAWNGHGGTNSTNSLSLFCFASIIDDATSVLLSSWHFRNSLASFFWYNFYVLNEPSSKKRQFSENHSI
jgi:hypothetical protein